MPCKPVPYDKIDLLEHLWSTQVSTRPRVLFLPFGAFQASKLVTAGDVIARPVPASPTPPPTTLPAWATWNLDTWYRYQGDQVR